VFRVRRPAPEDLRKLLDRARSQQLTYREVGATRGARPPSYLHDDAHMVVGTGRDAFDRAVRALRSWDAQRGAGVDVFPEASRVEDGETALLIIRFAVLCAVAPCRVVYVDEQADAFAFAYGTLPGHPERGEVAFSLAIASDGSVDFRITSFSQRAALLARLGSPFARRLQQRVTRRYFAAIRAAAGA